MRRWLFGDNGRAIALPFLFIYTPTIIQNSQFIIVITAVNCGLLLQLTGQLVNLSTCQLQIMITTVSCGLLLQLTRQLVNLSTRQLPI